MYWPNYMIKCVSDDVGNIYEIYEIYIGKIVTEMDRNAYMPKSIVSEPHQVSLL